MKGRAVFTLVLYCGLGVLASPPGPPNTDTADDEPDLLHMLDYFKGKSDMAMMVNFVKEMKLLTTIGKNLFKISPMSQNIIQNAAKTNAGIQILYKVIVGETPDLRDLYNLATKGKGDMFGTYLAERKKHKKYNAMIQMLVSNDTSGLASTSYLETLLDSFTERHFDLDPALVKAVYDGSVITTPGNMVQVNVLELISFMKKNSHICSRFGGSIGHPPYDFVNMLTMFEQLDTSNLAMIKAVHVGMNTTKYTVAGARQTLVTDPDATKLLQLKPKIQQMNKEKSQDQVAAESLFIDTSLSLWNMITRVIKDAEEDRNLSSA